MKKSLFNEHDMMNEDGKKLSDEIHDFINPLYKKWYAKGFRGSDIKDILISEISCTDAQIRLLAGIEKRKEEREKKK